ncbi:3-keto-5-aminohexanoate cleavage protein, partial [Xanthomonas citri pv. citri]
LDVATFNFGNDAFINTPAMLTAMAADIRASGVLPEIEVFEAGHARLATHLVETGVLAAPGHFQFCLGIDWAMPATAAAVDFLRDLLPPGATWSAFGIGRHQFPRVATAVAAGGHVRVGLEDNLHLSSGVLAPSNAALVERAVRIIEDLGET